MNSPLHPMRLVIRRTGLTPHVIRMWERRYGAVAPDRTDSNRRLYSENEIQRLLLLKELTDRGHSIGQIAKLGDERLGELLVREAGSPMTPMQPSKTVTTTTNRPVSGAKPGSIEEKSAIITERAWNCVVTMTPDALRQVLDEGSASIGQSALLELVVCPLMERIGEAWDHGQISAAHEHAATAAVRDYLGSGSRPFAEHRSAPVLIAATPSGQLHEIGAAVASAIARKKGWRVVYLGPSMPASELATAAKAHSARAVALSMIYPADDTQLPEELRMLRRLLPPSCAIIVGGRCAAGYRKVLEEIGASVISDCNELPDYLDELRFEGSGLTAG